MATRHREWNEGSVVVVVVGRWWEEGDEAIAGEKSATEEDARLTEDSPAHEEPPLSTSLEPECTSTPDVMLRYVIGHSTIRPATPYCSLASAATRCFASKRGAGTSDDEAEIDAARKWLAKLDADTIRNNAVCDVSFSRSSGPGGQNVNKYANSLSSIIAVLGVNNDHANPESPPKPPSAFQHPR